MRCLSASLLGAAALAGLALSPAPAAAADLVLATFPGWVIPKDAGMIQFDGKLLGYKADQVIAPFAVEPRFINVPGIDVSVQFTDNNGSGGGGLSGARAGGPEAATGTYSTTFTFGSVLGAAEVPKWHRYTLIWNKNGLKGVTNGSQKVAVFVDGVLNSTYWVDRPFTGFPAISGNVQIGFIRDIVGNRGNGVAMDNLRIFNGQGRLVLYNEFNRPVSGTTIVSETGPNLLFKAGYFLTGTDGLAIYGTLPP